MGNHRAGTLGNDEGAATAEFAAVLPAVLLIIGVVLGGFQLAAHRLILAAAAADIARIEARGEPGSVAERLALLPGPAPALRRSAHGDVLCVRLDARPGRGLLAALPVAGTGCALRSGP